MNCYVCKSENLLLLKEGDYYTGYFCNDCGNGRVDYFTGGCCSNPILIDIRFEQTNGVWVRRTGCKNCKSLVGSQKKKGDDFLKLPFLSQENYLLTEKNKKDSFDKLYNYIKLLCQDFKDTQISERRKYYEDYIKSENWKRVRKLVLERDDFLCQGCRIKKAVHVHHTTYDFLGDELLFQLISLCVDCHQKIHPEKNIL